MAGEYVQGPLKPVGTPIDRVLAKKAMRQRRHRLKETRLMLRAAAKEAERVEAEERAHLRQVLQQRGLIEIPPGAPVRGFAAGNVVVGAYGGPDGTGRHLVKNSRFTFRVDRVEVIA